MIAAFQAQSSAGSATRASAMRDAMIHLIDRDMYRLPDGREVFSYAHPLFWAPFSVIGDGGVLRRGSGS
jgi:CHAT domain-containing protein